MLRSQFPFCFLRNAGQTLRLSGEQLRTQWSRLADGGGRRSYVVPALLVFVLAASLNAPGTLGVGQVPVSGLESDLAAHPCATPLLPLSEGRRPTLYPWETQEGEREVFHPVSSLSWSVEGLPELTGMSRTIEAVLDYNVVRFPGVRGDFYAFLPGELYQQVYLRDLLTTTKIAQYLYGDAFLRGGLEETLAQQLANAPRSSPSAKAPFPGPGSLDGLLFSDGHGEKSTATSDEEPSVVQLAYLYYSVTGGPDWLGCTVNGQTVLSRLNMAMGRLLEGRQDPGTGLIQRVHTTDWGDVRFQGGPTPTQAGDSNEYWTASIFDQAWTYLALTQLATMNRAAGDRGSAARWEDQAERLRAATQRWLWQPERGYYRLHLHLTPLSHPFDEGAMVTIGNMVAVYAGLADDQQKRRIIDAVEQTSIRAGASKPGVSLYPPYPEGFFRHPQMHFQGQYQNGGLWDWWGGIQTTAEFEAGYSRLAQQHLLAIARDWSRHPRDIAEWQTVVTNRMQGSSKYAGAGGTVGEAVVSGLFGVEMTREGFSLSPRLGYQDGHIQVSQPASGNSLWMRQRVADGTLWLQYSTNHQKPGTLSVLLPSGTDAETLRLDGIPQLIQVRSVGRDRYLEVGRVPSGAHDVTVALKQAAVAPLSVAWEGHDVPYVLPTGRRADALIEARNVGSNVWEKAGARPVRTSYQWFDLTGRRLSYQEVPEAHSDLPYDVRPGEAVTVPTMVLTPRLPGLYHLRLDLLQEGVIWFNQADSKNLPLEALVRVADEPLAVEWLDMASAVVVDAGKQWALKLAFENTGLAEWRASGAKAVQVGVRWFRRATVSIAEVEDRTPFSDEDAIAAQTVRIVWEEVTPLRTLAALPEDVKPGEVASFIQRLWVPETPGLYRVQFDLLQMGGPEFSNKTPLNRPAEVLVTVRSGSGVRAP